MWTLVRAAAAAATALLVLTGCGESDGTADGDTSPSPVTRHGTADIGGYEVAYACRGDGNPVMILEAGLGAAGTSEWRDLMPLLDDVGVRVCTYDRAGTGTSDERPQDVGSPTAAFQARELHRLLERASISPPYVLVPHSYGGLIARLFADLYYEEVAGFVFEDVSTAWEIDLWPRWDDSPWIDGAHKIDIEATERQVLKAAPLADLPATVLSQATYKGEGIPRWATPIFARQQKRLAALGDSVIHLRADGSGHFIHRERPGVVVAAVEAVVHAARGDGTLPRCRFVFDSSSGTCLSST
jgi:pimeloyl-ACP methyl ester carboxylesterase